VKLGIIAVAAWAAIAVPAQAQTILHPQGMGWIATKATNNWSAQVDCMFGTWTMSHPAPSEFQGEAVMTVKDNGNGCPAGKIGVSITAKITMFQLTSANTWKALGFQRVCL